MSEKTPESTEPEVPEVVAHADDAAEDLPDCVFHGND